MFPATPKNAPGRAKQQVKSNMKYAKMPVPELGLIAATRGMLAGGIALLIADKIAVEKRKKIAWPLVAIGVLSTAPLVIDIIKRIREAEA